MAESPQADSQVNRSTSSDVADEQLVGISDFVWFCRWSSACLPACCSCCFLTFPVPVFRLVNLTIPILVKSTKMKTNNTLDTETNWWRDSATQGRYSKDRRRRWSQVRRTIRWWRSCELLRSLGGNFEVCQETRCGWFQGADVAQGGSRWCDCFYQEGLVIFWQMLFHNKNFLVVGWRDWKSNAKSYNLFCGLKPKAARRKKEEWQDILSQW